MRPGSKIEVVCMSYIPDSDLPAPSWQKDAWKERAGYYRSADAPVSEMSKKRRESEDQIGRASCRERV